ncbi:hypothetical protein A54_108 [Septuagintavirus sv54]|uniref:Uncharacterized protein n=1 Tax=Escherichia phage A5-4 TaxID=2996162 RepID=A0AAE9TI46_9CAUD|nr:hypothetical protein A54_108 [Escherichia phage A5-4]
MVSKIAHRWNGTRKSLAEEAEKRKEQKQETSPVRRTYTEPKERKVIYDGTEAQFVYEIAEKDADALGFTQSYLECAYNNGIESIILQEDKDKSQYKSVKAQSYRIVKLVNILGIDNTTYVLRRLAV